MTLQRAISQLDNSHTPLCRFKKDQFKPVITDWSKYLSTEQGSGLSSRNSLYLHSNEIFGAACESYYGTKGQLKFNLALAKEKLANFHGQDLVE